MATRMNSGKSDNLPVLFEGIEFNNPETSTLEVWTIYDRGDKDGLHRWKLSAAVGTTVAGKANYTLNAKGSELYTNDDGSKLRKERPGLFTILAGLAAGEVPQSDSLSTEEDPYGDLAMNRGQKLNQVQQWNRALLKMRETELHWKCRPDRFTMTVKQCASWEHSIRSLWFGIFKGNLNDAVLAHKQSIAADAKVNGYQVAVESTVKGLTSDMEQKMILEAQAFITRRGPGEIDYDEYMRVVKAFYDGEYKPNSMTTLAAKFDQISGAVAEDFEEIAAIVPAYGSEKNEILATFEDLL